jgi:uncharacterized membrane protein
MEPTLQLEEKSVYELFRISVLIKGAISVAEVVAGAVVFLVPPALVLRVAEAVAEDQLARDTDSALATHLLNAVEGYSPELRAFIALYLVSRGLIKAFLIAALLKNKLWAYPASLAVLGLFVLYQFWELYIGHSLVIIGGITAFDLIVMYFIWREYQIVKEHHGRQPYAG